MVILNVEGKGEGKEWLKGKRVWWIGMIRMILKD